MIRLATIVASLTLPFAAQALPLVPAATPVPAVESPFEAMAADAARYAAAFGVTPVEAIRRLEAQEASVPLTQRLAQAYADRLAGITIEHRPDYRIVLHLVGAPAPDTTIATAPGGVPVVTRGGGLATRAATLAAIAAHQADIRAAMPSPPGMGVDPATGALLVLTRPGDLDREDAAATARRLTGLAGVPVEVRTWGEVEADAQAVDPAPATATPVIPALGRDLAPSSSSPGSGATEQVRGDEGMTGAVVGGGRVIGSEPGNRFVCTTGFVVTDGAQTAIATAAHCPDTLEFVGTDKTRTPLTMLGAWGARTQDVQIHDAGAVLTPLFHADDPARVRTVATWRAREATRSGDYLCHRGERTGYSCALVRFPDFAPPGDLCAGPCPATWVAVAGPDCRGGDSGGPVFVGEVAFGLMKGNSTEKGVCQLYYYMPVDFLPPGWTVAYRGGG